MTVPPEEAGRTGSRADDAEHTPRRTPGRLSKPPPFVFFTRVQNLTGKELEVWFVRVCQGKGVLVRCEQRSCEQCGGRGS